MFLSTTDQVVILLASVYGGLMLGLIFDLYRFGRSVFRFGKTVTVIGDILFWVMGLVLALSIIYRSSSGLVRVYQLLGFGLGTALYIHFLSGIVQSLMRTLAYCVKGFSYTLIKVIRGPLVLLSNILWKPCSMIKSKVCKTFVRLGQDTRKYIPLLKNKK